MKNNRKVQHIEGSGNGFVHMLIHYTTGDVRKKLYAHASASRPHHMLIVIIEHSSEELILVRTNVLLRGRAELSSLFRNGQLAIVGDAEFDSWDRAEVVLV